MPTSGNYFHLHLVSDSTGETLITVARAVAAQYANVTAVEHVYPLVRSQKQLDRVLAEIEEAPGIVLFTLLEKDLVGRLEAKCQGHQYPEPVDHWPGDAIVRGVSWRGNDGQGRGPARSERGIFQAHRRLELHHDS